MIAVAMGDDGTINRAPWIDIKPAGGAEEAFVCEFDKRHKEVYAIRLPKATKEM
jgi:hypothetical protein